MTKLETIDAIGAKAEALGRALRIALDGLRCRCDELRMYGSSRLCDACIARAAALAELDK